MPLPKTGSRPRRELSRIVECERLKALTPRGGIQSNGEREEAQGQKALPREASRRKPAGSRSPHTFRRSPDDGKGEPGPGAAFGREGVRVHRGGQRLP